MFNPSLYYIVHWLQLGDNIMAHQPSTVYYVNHGYTKICVIL